MLQKTRQTLRIFILAIGFCLFVVVSIRSAQNVSNRQAVAGKPHLLPASAVAAAHSLPTIEASGSELTLAPAAAPAVASVPPAPSNDPAATTQPVVTGSDLQVSAASDEIAPTNGNADQSMAHGNSAAAHHVQTNPINSSADK